MLHADRNESFDFDRLFRLSSAYLAPISYFQLLLNAPQIWIDIDEKYQRQSYRNRCVINSSNGLITLSIPVEKPVAGKYAMRDMRIASHGEWQKSHWRSIETAYNSSPFFEYYQDDLIPFYERKWIFLLDFNMELQCKILQLIDLEPKILTENMGVEHWHDFRELIHPKKPDIVGNNMVYYQNFEFRNGFQPGLSILDLLMNMGNEAVFVLQSKKSLYLYSTKET